MPSALEEHCKARRAQCSRCAGLEDREGFFFCFTVCCPEWGVGGADEAGVEGGVPEDSFLNRGGVGGAIVGLTEDLGCLPNDLDMMEVLYGEATWNT